MRWSGSPTVTSCLLRPSVDGWPDNHLKPWRKDHVVHPPKVRRGNTCRPHGGCCSTSMAEAPDPQKDLWSASTRARPNSIGEVREPIPRQTGPSLSAMTANYRRNGTVNLFRSSSTPHRPWRRVKVTEPAHQSRTSAELHARAGRHRLSRTPRFIRVVMDNLFQPIQLGRFTTPFPRTGGSTGA